ncbi:hypothetical protein [Rubinisphaera margarita]|uniref:hypothetical protein n=1 Tax=Rubinisphaera margarita TaxID=2909586 RepID=UPI001EE9680B|nr:hypothetical protein [Rubinisphaera margarita]MCG6154814.1 hypothetical protein [Rubinisphaera margarita]
MDVMILVLLAFAVFLLVPFAGGIAFVRESRQKSVPLETDGRQKPGFAVLGILGLVLVLGAIVTPALLEWMATSPNGGEFYGFGVLVFTLSLLASLTAIPFFLAGVFFKEVRLRSLLLLLFAISFFTGGLTSARFARSVRQAGLEKFTRRSEPLIEAIKSYEAEHRAPPVSLDELVPEFIAEVPTTGMSAYPRYDYYAGRATEKEYCGNPWVLRVGTPRGFGDWDEMLYFPTQNYDEYKYHQFLEPVNDWAYVNE